MGGATTELKVRRDDLGETQTRKITVSTHIRWEELEEKLRSRFDIGKTDKMVLSYIDEEEETITVSSDEEVADALRNKSQLCFNLMTKKTNKGYNYSEIHTEDDAANMAARILQTWFSEKLPEIIDQVTREVISKISKAEQPASSASSFSHVLVYPNTLNISKLATMGRKPQSGDVLEYRIPSSYLTFNQASTKQIWGVGIYTYDSDIVKAIAHSGIYRLKQNPPDNDLSVKIRYSPGLNLYCGAISNSFKSDEHKQCSLSYVIESVSTIPKGSANAV